MNKDIKNFGKLLTPSLISGMFVIVASLIIIVLPIIESRINTSPLHSEYLQVISSQTSQPGQTVNNIISSNKLLASLPVAILWGVIGLFCYNVVAQVMFGYGKGRQLFKSMHYVHANPEEIKQQTILHTTVRLVAAVVWIVYLLQYFHKILPGIVADALKHSSDLNNLHNLGALLLALVAVMLATHIHVILARLLTLRTRVFVYGR